MKKSFFLLIIGIFFISIVQAAEIDRVLENVNDDEIVKINVALSETATSGLFRIANKVDVNQTISELSDNYNVEYVAKTFNGITIEVSGKELEELKQRKDISRIEKAVEFRTFLQDSKGIINSTLTGSLQINGVNLTGQGQTVCIIDSGINYTHSAFGGCTTEQYLAGNCSKVIGGQAYYNPVNSSNANDTMGDSNHGTHVAGIVAGISPDVKIVAMKACGPTTACNQYAVEEAINWCVSNSEVYNISVISMSLGTPENYTSNCNEDIPSFTSAVNSAVAKNISVIAASGNSANNTALALPACISNVTAVGSTNKDDSISSFSNRNNLMKLFAPGGSINSSLLNGNYGGMSGTSMAAPHAAAAFVIINQLLDYLDIEKTPKQIENVFTDNGKNITDTTGVNYTRINIYNAVLSLDTINPNITMIYPIEDYISSNDSIIVSVNVSDWELVNLTLQLKNSSESVINETMFNLSGSFNETSIIFYNLTNGSYNITASSIDSKLNLGMLSRMFTITNSNITLTSPANGYAETSNSSNIIFNFTLLKNFTNCSLIINETDIVNFDVIDYTITQNVSSILSSGIYSWKINCSIDDISEISGSRTITLNAPVVEEQRRSGGGGGGSSKATNAKITLNTAQIAYGYTRELKKQDILQFDLSGKGTSNHSLTIDSVGNSSVNFTLRSNPVKSNLSVGESKKFNLSSQYFYDLYVELNSIKNGNANMTIKQIYDPILNYPEKSNYSGGIEFITFNETVFEENKDSAGFVLSVKNYIFIVIIISAAIFLIAFILHFRQKRNISRSLKVRFNKEDF